MTTYKLSAGGTVVIKDDFLHIPADPSNFDYQEFIIWQNDGNIPDPEYTLEEYREKKRKDINTWRNNALNDPNSTVDASGYTWQTDPLSIEQLNNAITVYGQVGSTPTGFEWRDANNTNHAADLALLVSIADARAVAVNNIWQYSWQLKADLDLTTTIEEIDTIVWNPT